jgi:predicted acyl esterase
MQREFVGSGQQPVSDYGRPPEADEILCDRDVVVPMRDGVKLVIDVYRPAAAGRYPVLLAFGGHSKEIQGPEIPKEFPPQPAWSSLWVGHMEAGDTRFFVSRGYAHVVGSPRGMHKSEDGGSREWDSYDLIEWIAQQPWCDGNVGMIGIGAFAAEQFKLARQHPPHLKAIFAYDGRGAYGPLGSFREEYPGGVIHLLRYLMDHFSGVHRNKGAPSQLSPPREALWREAMSNPDYRMYPHVLNVLHQKGQHMPQYFDVLLEPYDDWEVVEASERAVAAISIPAYIGSGWYGYTYKTHLSGAQNYFRTLTCCKRLVLTGPAHLDRPLRALRTEALRWYDHWLKGIDSGMLAEPPVRFWVMGANEWRSAQDWPLTQTRWTKLFLNSWERLTPEPFVASSVDEFIPPDAFVQMPPTQTNRIARLRYLSDPLPRDLLVAGPMVLNLFAAIDQDDTNWIIILKDVGPDMGVRSAREGEREISNDLPERELTRGWLKASYRALDPARSKPWKPWHRLTREAREPVIPGEVTEYAIEILSTANLFRRGHRICVEITSHDLPTGVSGATNVEYIPNHICSSKTTLHKIYHDAKHPSHLLLPVIPEPADSSDL